MRFFQTFFRVVQHTFAVGFIVNLSACGESSSFVEKASSQSNDISDASASNSADANILSGSKTTHVGASESSSTGECGQDDCNSGSKSVKTTASTTTSDSSTTVATTSTSTSTTSGTSSSPGSGNTVPPSSPMSIKTLDFSNLWAAGDDGSYFSLNLDTGVWDWKNMTVYSPNYDNMKCQDYVGLIGTLNVVNLAGVVTAANVNMDWRFNPACTTLPKRFTGNPALPGAWGPLVNLQKATIASTGGDGVMKIIQVGRFLRFDVYHSLTAKVSVTLSN